MQTEKELNADILKLTTLIQEKFPELSKFIVDMPIAIPDEAHPEINVKVLKGYCESLKELVKKYNLSAHGEQE